MKDQSEITQLKADLDLAGTKVRATENEALAELEILDQDLQKNIKLKEELETEVRRLEKELRKIESSPITINKQQKEIIDTSKRFKTLYKNLEISSRAIDGLIDLETNLQLQSEELIHTINEDGSKVPVKRKVFTRKGALPVFECEFGRSGRIYWSAGSGGKRQVWVIGTKNTQNKDLAYIDKL
jgi:predicted RNase H-like nuclease (RuvC/YqgF family)